MAGHYFKFVEDWAQFWLEELGMRLKRYSENEFELIDTDNCGMGTRSYYDCLKQLEGFVDQAKECKEETLNNVMSRSTKLLYDIMSNVDGNSLQDFLEIQGGFSKDEAEEWIQEVKQIIEDEIPDIQ